MTVVPEKPTLDGIEARWMQRWEDDGVYRFDRGATRDQIFSIDTPPPTVSGSIHMGTVFGYTQFDSLARYQRMAGRKVFFPIGWDDNGLATERRTQNYFGARCDPTLAHDPDFQPPHRGDVPKGFREVPVSRPNFVALCEEMTAIDEAAFEEIFRRLGLSVDWSLLYATVNASSRRTSQLAFLRNLARGEAYSSDAPTVWDVDDRTAVAQAEIEDRERAGAYHLLAFHHVEDGGAGGDIHVDTTRPELVVSCVALVAHPDDERFQDSFGTTVRTPVFGVEVPIVAHPLAQPDKGTGIAMVCTFGDTTDVTWWRELDLPTRNVIGRDGRLVATAPEWLDGEAARAAYRELAGLTVKQAQAKMVELLQNSGELQGEPRRITHAVKFYERGSRPLEIVTSRQWYIRNGGRDQDRREALLLRGKELAWYPEHMHHRYDHWVEGLNGDWLISRQRFYGVPIPLWYPLDADGEPDYERPITPAEAALPIDPSTDVPPGYAADQRGVPGGFAGDTDVMDTWATSSLTPQIAAQWAAGDPLFEQVFPYDIRPQGPDIIRTWLFSTVVRAHYEHDCLPWKAATLNGWILDPDRKKMSKSKGNVVTPMGLFDTYGTDAVRYWALSANRGVDTAFSEEQIKVGRRLATKLLNASKFVLGTPDPGQPVDPGALAPVDPGALDPGALAPVDPGALAPVDNAMLVRLDAAITEATRAFEGFDYARGLEHTEAFFWWFCDDYLELVKTRALRDGHDTHARSARHALRCALDAVQRLFAPVLPFAAEEAWSWWREGSVHAAAWPQPSNGSANAQWQLSLDAASEVLATVRRAKTEAKRSQRWAVAHLALSGPEDWCRNVEPARDDLVAALTVNELTLAPADAVAIEIALATD